MIDTAVACSFGRLCPKMRSAAKESAKKKRSAMVETANGASVNALCTRAPGRQTVLCPAKKKEYDESGEEKMRGQQGRREEKPEAERGRVRGNSASPTALVAPDF